MIMTFYILTFQLKKRGYTNIDALDGSEEMLKIAKTKNVYKNFYKAYLGPTPIEVIPKGNILFFKRKDTRQNNLNLFCKEFKVTLYVCCENQMPLTHFAAYLYYETVCKRVIALFYGNLPRLPP